jgi:PAS domain S-box-containing protein
MAAHKEEEVSAPSSLYDAAEVIAPIDGPRSVKPRVLLVEDEKAIREHIVEALAADFEITGAVDGKQALLAVLRGRPDVIVTDIVMPGLDGVELVRLLRDTPSTSTIPILLTSGKAAEDLRIEGFEVGADSYLAKPYSERELKVRIRAMLDGARRRDEEATQRALERTTAERAALLESITDAFYAVDEQHRLNYVNQRALTYFGRPLGELLNRPLWEVLPESQPDLGPIFERVRHEANSIVFDSFTTKLDGWHEVHVFPSGKGVAVLLRDVTERRRAEVTLRESELHFRVIADAVPALMWRSDHENRGTWFNKTWLEFTGRALTDELGMGWAEVIHPDDFDEALRDCQQCLERRAPLEMKFRMRRRDGEYRWMLDRGNPVYDGPDGKFSGYIGTCVDITDLKRSADALLAAEQRYKAFVANSTEAIWRYELREPLDLNRPVDAQLAHIQEHGYLAELNDAMARMYGFERADQMVGMPLTETLPADDEAAQAYLRLLIDARFALPDVESQEKDREGRLRYFSNSITPVIEDGHLLRAWGTQRDITDRKRSEEQMKLAERRKDEFLATLAHELRNPLAPIRTGIHILKTRELPPGEGKRLLEMMDRQMAHTVRLLDDLLDVSRISRGRLELRREPVDLARVIKEALETCAPLLEMRAHRVAVNGADSRLIVDGDPDRLTQVFANLISNSAKYTDAGGDIALKLYREGEDAVVTVIDNGTGIPPDALEEVFAMFSQVRSRQGAAEGGLGIGLSVVRTLVEMHGGHVVARSDGAGTGSTFEVRLPLLRESADAVDEAPPTPA